MEDVKQSIPETEPTPEPNPDVLKPTPEPETTPEPEPDSAPISGDRQMPFAWLIVGVASSGAWISLRKRRC